jgi:hypothetical protein
VESARISTFSALRKAGFPVYPKIQNAVYSIGIYWEWVAKQAAAQRETTPDRMDCGKNFRLI